MQGHLLEEKVLKSLALQERQLAFVLPEHVKQLKWQEEHTLL